ncbi:hypothetical protein ACFE04_016243 [Oxalis oulophora]
MRYRDRHACTHNVSVATLNISELSVLELDGGFTPMILPTSGHNISALDGFFKNPFSLNDFIHPPLLGPALSMPLLHASVFIMYEYEWVTCARLRYWTASGLRQVS